MKCGGVDKIKLLPTILKELNVNFSGSTLSELGILESFAFPCISYRVIQVQSFQDSLQNDTLFYERPLDFIVNFTTNFKTPSFIEFYKQHTKSLPPRPTNRQSDC